MCVFLAYRFDKLQIQYILILWRHDLFSDFHYVIYQICNLRLSTHLCHFCNLNNHFPAIFFSVHVWIRFSLVHSRFNYCLLWKSPVRFQTARLQSQISMSPESTFALLHGGRIATFAYVFKDHMISNLCQKEKFEFCSSNELVSMCVNRVGLSQQIFASSRIK